MQVTLNGERRELPERATIVTVLELLGRAADGRGVAVAIGGEVVPRSAWPSTQLADGAAVEVLSAVQGG